MTAPHERPSTGLRWLAAARVVGVIALIACVGMPFLVCRFPPLTDFPFHAVGSSIVRHHGDPAFGFERQFDLTPLSVPYCSLYVLGAFFMLFFDAVVATKLAATVLLSAVPIGLGTLAWGLRKSPWLGLTAAPLVWGHLTHWGFINFVSAIGIYMAVVGLSLRALTEPKRRTTGLLVLSVVLLHFTHVFRVPFALLSMGLVLVCLYPVTRRVFPVVLAIGVSGALFTSFWLLKPATLYAAPSFDPAVGRLLDIPRYVFDSFNDPWERQTFYLHFGVVFAVSIGSVVAARWAPHADAQDRSRREARATHLAVAGCVVGVLISYLVLPMEAGLVWYIFPREATLVVVVALALLPDLPRQPTARAGALFALSLSVWITTARVTQAWNTFDAQTADFSEISKRIPKAPRLSYLVFDHRGSNRTVTPFVHLPAYVQAEKGGHLSFHFAAFNASPFRYSKGADALVPPPFPHRWEFRPNLFEVREHGAFFDWFLVRSERDPRDWFAADRTIEFVERRGTWWLYERRRSGPGGLRERRLPGANTP